jgi:hypothetical protein
MQLILDSYSVHFTFQLFKFDKIAIKPKIWQKNLFLSESCQKHSSNVHEKMGYVTQTTSCTVQNSFCDTKQRKMIEMERYHTTKDLITALEYNILVR